MQRVDICIVALSSPVLVGIYENFRLKEEIKSIEKTSEVLPKIFKEIFEKYEINSIYFANGPGSYMSIKLVYIFLKTLSIIKDIPIFATDGFYFTNSAIKALGDRYFIKKDNKIEVVKLENIATNFNLPDNLDKTQFTNTIEPLYILEAVELPKEKN